MPSLVVEACSVLGIEPGPKGGAGLGPAPPASDVIQSAFKKLAIKWHPDRNPANVKEATSRMAEISAARDLLVDPPTNALFDEPPAPAASSGPSKAAAALSKGVRAFEGDVTEEIDSGELTGEEPAALFEAFGLWAVFKCNGCNAVCCRLRKNKYSCMCSHRLKDHDAANGFRCAAKGACPCRRFEFQVQDSDQPHKCRCHHAAIQHAKVPPFECTLCADCAAFDSPWTCNCGHVAKEHSTCFVQHKYTERTREWVAGGLRQESVALANKFRQRSVADRVSFIQRAAAAKAAGYPSWKAMVREAKLHEQHGTVPQEPLEPPAGGGSAPAPGAVAAEAAERCGECEPGTSAGGAPGVVDGGGFDRAAATKAGFNPSNETTHGMSTQELRDKLAAAGVGVRPANAGDFGLGGAFGL